jgi:hypothetical protein
LRKHNSPEFGSTPPKLAHIRYKRAMQDRAFDSIRDLPILETHSTQFLRVLEAGSVATNVFFPAGRKGKW